MQDGGDAAQHLVACRHPVQLVHITQPVHVDDDDRRALTTGGALGQPGDHPAPARHAGLCVVPAQEGERLPRRPELGDVAGRADQAPRRPARGVADLAVHLERADPGAVGGEHPHDVPPRPAGAHGVAQRAVQRPAVVAVHECGHPEPVAAGSVRHAEHVREARRQPHAVGRDVPVPGRGVGNRRDRTAVVVGLVGQRDQPAARQLLAARAPPAHRSVRRRPAQAHPAAVDGHDQGRGAVGIRPAPAVRLDEPGRRRVVPAHTAAVDHQHGDRRQAGRRDGRGISGWIRLGRHTRPSPSSGSPVVCGDDRTATGRTVSSRCPVLVACGSPAT